MRVVYCVNVSESSDAGPLGPLNSYYSMSVAVGLSVCLSVTNTLTDK